MGPGTVSLGVRKRPFFGTQSHANTVCMTCMHGTWEQAHRRMTCLSQIVYLYMHVDL